MSMPTPHRNASSPHASGWQTPRRCWHESPYHRAHRLRRHRHWFIDKKRAGGGILADMGVYLLDQILHLLDWPEPHTVEATAFRGHPHALPSERIHDEEEQLTLFSRLANGVTLTLDLSGRSHEPPLHRLGLLGSRAGLRIEHGEDRAESVPETAEEEVQAVVSTRKWIERETSTNPLTRIPGPTATSP